MLGYLWIEYLKIIIYCIYIYVGSCIVHVYHCFLGVWKKYNSFNQKRGYIVVSKLFIYSLLSYFILVISIAEDILIEMAKHRGKTYILEQFQPTLNHIDFLDQEVFTNSANKNFLLLFICRRLCHNIPHCL